VAGSESAVSKKIRLIAARRGWLLWRNNCGAFKDDRGVWIRYGLANESKAMNSNIKSSDLIGIKPTTITPEMVGATIGVFVAIETKAPGWKFKGTEREVAQKKFIDLVNSKGGVGVMTDDISFDDWVKLLYPHEDNLGD
jgi:hypothetical protein